MYVTITPLSRGIAAIILTWMFVTSAPAVALRPEKPTDASVCDLAPNTNEFLGRRMLIPAVAAKEDRVEAYFRMAAMFVATSCRNGQLLVLQGESEGEVDDRALTRLAESSCAIADVRRTSVAIFTGSREVNGFELRCTILKMSDLGESLNRFERADPMAALRLRLESAAASRPNGGTTSATTPSQTPATPKECNKLSLSSLLSGGNCR